MSDTEGGKQKSEKPANITLSPAFKLVFLSVLSLTVLSIVGQFFIIFFFSDPSTDAKALMVTCDTLTKTGFGAIVGLLGGKSL